MELQVIDRLAISNMLPAEDSMENMLLIKDIKEKTNFSKEELEKLNFKEKDNLLSWESEESKDIQFSSAELDFLKSLISKLSAEKKVSLNMLSSYLKIKNA